MRLLDWMIVILLNGAIIAYGFRTAEGTTSKSDWFLAGRTLPWWALGMSMFATSVDNADFVSVTGHVYNNGLHILTVFTLATVLGSCLAAFVIVPVIFRAGCLMNAEFRETRFGPGMRLFSALIEIQYRTAVLGLMIWSIFLTLQGLVGLPPWLAWTAIVCLVVASAAYTGLGGLSSVVWTDVLQSLVIIAGGVYLFTSVLSAVGGWNGRALGHTLTGTERARRGCRDGYVAGVREQYNEAGSRSRDRA
jgi:SSS family solute:Na+ symporter